MLGEKMTRQTKEEVADTLRETQAYRQKREHEFASLAKHFISKIDSIHYGYILAKRYNRPQQKH